MTVPHLGSILVLHEVGDVAGGGPYAEAFAAWAQVIAPDLPGHGSQPELPGQNYGLTDPMYVVTRLFADQGIEKVDTVVGVGVSGWSAQLLALAGRADRMVLVDGLGNPFLSIDDLLDRRMKRVRIIADSPDPLADAPPPTHGDRELAERAARDTEVPVLLLGTDSDEHRAFLDIFPNAEHRVTSNHDPRVIAETVAEWAMNS